MLDSDTKRKIDSARQILVGVVPDPKSQVEQITTALIYKFMDDMDRQSVELGGKTTFFTGDFSEFAWTKLLDRRLSGRERLDLYTRSITDMPRNPNIPQTFRGIFKGAFLPYNNPETLSLFLKEINGFSYDNSENLGDAFEYLLSILGSQGDAGQFRTPRHIIDFIVEVINPKKNETVLDPACGTAGFLISAYKHILESNSSQPQGAQKADNGTSIPIKAYAGDLLTPDEKTKLATNLTGYEISPDMVRLSIANMYLHGFVNPGIHEYDTLTSEKRWNERFDVILANPPFMTPKGGIRPHGRFAMQAKRSEVLFVDYIMEHLTMNGRAGIIVPEGIIFQSQNAYKQLRKKLVEDGLFAVVSLPPGVFNPYSGVKTSVLFFDNQLAKRADEILFVKVENDGYDLGAQRRPIGKNDLPDALKILTAWKHSPSPKGWQAEPDGVVNKTPTNGVAVIAVKKDRIAKDGDYNLTGERYREIETHKNQKWPMVELGNVCEISNGSTPKRTEKDYWEKGTIPWFTVEDIRNQGRIIRNTKQRITEKGFNKSSTVLLPKNSVLLCCTASVGEYAFTEIELTTNQQFNGLTVKDPTELIPKFLYWLASTFKTKLERLSGKTSFNFVSLGTLRKIKIPLPPLEVQKEIVAQIEVKQNAINHAKEVIKNLEKERRYFGDELRKSEDVEWVELGEVSTLEYGKPLKKQDRKGGDYPVFGSNGVVGYHNEYLIPGPFIIVGRKGSSGVVTYSDKSGFPIDTTFYVKLKNETKLNLKFFYLSMKTLELGKLNNQSAVPGLNRADAYKVKIPLPPFELQRQLVTEAEKEEEIIAANRRLIEIMEGRIRKVLEEV